MTKKTFVGVLVLALAVLASACGEGTPTSPSSNPNPTPGQTRWSTVGELRFDPSVVTLGRYVQIDQMFVDHQTGITAEVTFEITCPNGVVDKRVATAASTTVGVSAFGYGYYPQMAGSYSVKTTIRQWVGDQKNGTEERSGSFQAVK